MAQAARLNLRMQKELKILMTDPPPGVSLPQLSHSQQNPSLTTLEAKIEGPEGTAYAKGVFTVKIQIPERYPFQPPNVTFLTPIYHPNIDSGGRICLDILNLPPKGAWQPSLNISTVLVSIGLLLSDPNPDDGLMAEASREYKYNRQDFDQKARSWTEKFANAQNTGSCSSSAVTNPTKELATEERKVLEAASENAVTGNKGRRKRLRLTGEKLSSLKPLIPAETNWDENNENVAPCEKLPIFQSQKPVVGDSSGSFIQEHGKFSGEPKCLDEDKKKGFSGESFSVAKDSIDIASIVVADSEDSDEDERPSRLRLSLMRKQRGMFSKP